MRARVINLGRGARGFLTVGGATVLLDPGASTILDLAPHPAHDAWIAAGEVGVAVEEAEDPPPSRVKSPTRGAPSRSRDA
jgi:hypothetical protein